MKEISYIFGFDISSACIGWCIFADNTYFDSGYMKFDKKTDLYDRSRTFRYWLEAKLRELNCVDLKIYIEAPKLGFGKTTAKTLSVLQRFNGMCSQVIYGLSGVKPELVDERSARKKAGFAISRKINQKEKIQVGNQVMNLPYFPKDHIKRNRNDRIIDECYDETDAIVICLSNIPS